MTIRSAPLRPMPGTAVSELKSLVAMARRSSRGGWTASMVCASFGPTPFAVCSSSNRARSSSSAKPYSVSESSRTTSEVASRAVSPSRSRASVPGEHETERPTPPTSTTAPSGPSAATVPLTLAITAPPSRALR